MKTQNTPELHEDAPELLQSLAWMVSQFEGESGAGEEYWSQFPQFLKARELIAKHTTQ